MTPERMPVLREDLARASCASERLPVLAEMIDLAAELSQTGGDDAADAKAALDGVLRELCELRAPAGSALDPDDQAFTLYLVAQACLLRDSGSDLDDAIACLRELRDDLLAEPLDPDGAADPAEPEPADTAEPMDTGEPMGTAEPMDTAEPMGTGDVLDFGQIMTEVEVKLGYALFKRVTRSDGDVDDLDAASAALRAALAWSPSDASVRPGLIMGLAWCFGLRYVGYDGTQDHRLAGLALAAEGLAAPGATEDETASCHVIVAWLALTRQLTGEQRSAMLRQQEMEAARQGKADAMLAALTDVRIDPSDARTALRHLRQVPDGAELAEDLGAMAPSLAGLAHLVLMRDGQVSEDIGQVADQLRNVARERSAATPERGEMLALRAAMLSARAEGDGHQDELGAAAEALQDAAALLPEGHPMRSPLADQLGRSLRQQVDHADSAGDFAAGVEPVMAMLEQVPPDDPQLARALTLAAVHLLSATPGHRAAVPFDRLIAQLDRLTTRLPPDDPARHLGEAMRWAAIGTKAAIEHQPDQVKDATTELRQRGARLPADSIVRPVFLIGVISALIERYAMTGELRLLEEAEEEMKRATAVIEEAAARDVPGESAALDSMRGQLAYLQTIIGMAHAQHEPAGLDLTQTVADMERAAELTKTAQGVRPRMVAELETVRAMRELRAPSRGPAMSLGQPERDAFAAILTQVQAMRRDHIDYPALAAQAASGLMMRGIVDRDQTAMGQGIALLAEACSVPHLTYRERPRLLSAYGFALLSRHDLTRDPRDLSLAIDRLEEARRAVEQELGSPSAASVLQNLAFAYRVRGNAARGDVDRAVTVGLGALRERAGDVLLQDNDANALLAARRATNDATEMGRWFLAHDRPGAAIEALEYGRGTVLHAATSGARLVQALEDAGRAGLAAEWARHMSGGDAADDLRYRVMTAIEGSAAEAWLLAPSSLSDITAALRASHADTLVYLLPQSDEGPGLAVLADADGNVRPLYLPRLRTGTGSPVDSFLQARRAAQGKRQADEGSWRAALGELCDWAWDVAIGPLLEAIPARSRGSRRVVLVPGGELGLVAWHAARQRIAGGGYRYAMQEAVFSYASSARQFVITAGRQPRPWTEQP
ncbi:MAG: hypothetical protein ABSB76_14785, partial [Streptosporangiaceae bacterium]